MKNITIFRKFIKLNFNNSFEYISDSKKWRISPFFRFILRICSPCRIGIWFIILYFLYLPILEKFKCNDLICIIGEFFILVFFISIFELFLAFIAPIEIENEKKIKD